MARENQQQIRIGDRVGSIRIEKAPRTDLHMRLFNRLLWHFFQFNDDETDIYAADLTEITAYVDIKGRVESQLTLACESLSRTVVKWELADRLGNTEAGFSTLLSQAWCEGGRLYYSLPSRLKSLLRHEKAFSLVHLDVLSLFKGPYARAVYDAISPLVEVETRGWWEPDAFRHLAGVAADNRYARFSELRKRVIEPALEEINALSDLRATVEYRRRGNRVTGIKFRVARKNDPLFAQCLYLPGADPEKMGRSEALEQAFEAYKAARVCEITGSMSAPQVEALEKAFVNGIQGNRVLMKKFDKDGFDNLSIRLRYEAFLEKMLLSDEQADFKRFMEREGASRS
jgi:hypothetical protein